MEASTLVKLAILVIFLILVLFIILAVSKKGDEALTLCERTGGVFGC